MEHGIPKNLARDSKTRVTDMDIVETLTIISIVTRDLAKTLLLQTVGTKGGTPNGNRCPFKKM